MIGSVSPIQLPRRTVKRRGSCGRLLRPPSIGASLYFEGISAGINMNVNSLPSSHVERNACICLPGICR